MVLGGSVGGGDRPDESFSIILTTSLGFLQHYPSPLVLVRMECREVICSLIIKYANTDKQKSAKTFAIQSGISDPHSNHTRSEDGNGPDGKLVSRLSEYFNILPAVNIWV